MSARVQRLRERFDRLHLDAFLVTFSPHLRYVSGFTGSSGIGVITHDAAYLITDSRYSTQAKQQTHGWKISITPDSHFDEIQRLRLLRNGWRTGFDGNTFPFSSYQTLRKKLPKVKFLPNVDMIENIAAVKDESEIMRIKHAVAITDRVLSEILDILHPGMSEQDVAAEISYRQRRYGAESDAFEIIVASGERGVLPHGRASSKKIRRGDFVTLDAGCVYEGYHSDLTRTVSVGKPKSEARKMYQVVLDTQARAIAAAGSGVLARDLDAVARGYMREKGYEKYFSHSLGHGLGLQIHEPPRISKQSNARLEAGNVITIEPGIYIPDVGGVRIEDDILIKNAHCEVLSSSPKELLVI